MNVKTRRWVSGAMGVTLIVASVYGLAQMPEVGKNVTAGVDYFESTVSQSSDFLESLMTDEVINEVNDEAEQLPVDTVLPKGIDVGIQELKTGTETIKEGET